jgi:hypothetical protein
MRVTVSASEFATESSSRVGFTASAQGCGADLDRVQDTTFLGIDEVSEPARKFAQ